MIFVGFENTVEHCGMSCCVYCAVNRTPRSSWYHCWKVCRTTWIVSATGTRSATLTVPVKWRQSGEIHSLTVPSETALLGSLVVLLTSLCHTDVELGESNCCQRHATYLIMDADAVTHLGPCLCCAVYQW